MPLIVSAETEITKIAQEMDVGTWRALLFFACFNDDNDDDDNKNNSNTISNKVVVAIVIRPYISNSSTLFLASETVTT